MWRTRPELRLSELMTLHLYETLWAPKQAQWDPQICRWAGHRWWSGPLPVEPQSKYWHNIDIILTILSDEKCCIELQDSVAETQADSVEPLRSISTDFHISQSRTYWLCADTSAPDCQSRFKHATCVCVWVVPRGQTVLHWHEQWTTY